MKLVAERERRPRSTVSKTTASGHHARTQPAACAARQKAASSPPLEQEHEPGDTGLLFHNQRSSRETELLKEFSVHVVRAWLGNAPRVALKHDARVTDNDFKKATRGDSKRQAG